MAALSVVRFPAEANAESMLRGVAPLWQQARSGGGACALLLNHAAAGAPSIWSEQLADSDGSALVRSWGAACVCCERSGTLVLRLAALFRDLSEGSPQALPARTVFLLVGPAASESGLRRQLRWMQPTPLIRWAEPGLL
ncbi:MAG: hypothetical protein ACKO3C_03890 [Betaproteobacteria bacterium]|nr:hypothetical protein [Betaproteobacteria bacterium]